MAQVSPSRVADKIMIRLPDGMRDQIAQSARENHRSVNAEVVHHLTKVFGQAERTAPERTAQPERISP